MEEVNTKHFTLVVNRGVDEVDAAEQVVGVIEVLDEMAQALGRIRGEVEDIIELMLGEQPVHQSRVGDRTLDELCAVRKVVAEAAAQVVEAKNPIALVEQAPADL